MRVCLCVETVAIATRPLTKYSPLYLVLWNFTLLIFGNPLLHATRPQSAKHIVKVLRASSFITL